jgi:hypothetical protein
MHFIFSEMRIAMLDRKIPPYAPYIMRLILDKGIEGEFEIEEDIQFEGVEAHKPIKLYKKTAHLMTSTSRAFTPSDSSGVVGGNHYASGCRRKNADPTSGSMGQDYKKLKWWQKAMFCMNNDVRHTQYNDYVDHKHLRKKQHGLDARLRVVEKGMVQALNMRPKNKTYPWVPSPLASGMKAPHLIERSWWWSRPRARKLLRRMMKRMMKMRMEVKKKVEKKRKRTRTTTSDLLEFSPFLAS